MTKTVALTGGTGFLGAAIIEALRTRGDRVRALARNPGKLTGAGVDIVEGDLDNTSALGALADGADLFIHCAGLTHARRDVEFDAVNVEGAARAAEAAAAAGARLIHISSMAARNPACSAYAASKLASETAVARAGGDHVSLRAPAIYGPGDSATLPYFKLVKAGLAPEPGADPAPRASILYVGDVAAAVIAAGNAPAGGVYEIGDERADGHSWEEIGAALGAAFGKAPRRIRAPRWILGPYAAIAAGAVRLAGGAPMVTPGKIAEFFHPDWVARDNLLSDATSWRPATPLKEGFAKTVRWYQENGLL